MKSILTILLILSSIIQYAPQAIAENKKPPTTQKPAKQQPSRKPGSPKTPSRKPVFVPPKPPKGLTPIPGRKTGMGSRDNCPAVSIPLTALAPQTQQQNKSNTSIVGGLTSLERPNFFFYVPYTQKTGSSAEFSLLDSKRMDVHRQKTALPTQPGIIKISLPNTVALKAGQNYRWYFKVRCRNRKASIPIFVTGYIHRNNFDYRIQEQLKTANPQQQAAIYAQNGIWFDALNTLAQLRQSSQNPSVEQDWQTLLQSVNLDGIATANEVNLTN